MNGQKTYKEMNQPDAHVNVLFPIPCIIRKIFQPKLHYPMAEPHPASGTRGASVAVLIFLIQGKFRQYQLAINGQVFLQKAGAHSFLQPKPKTHSEQCPVTRESVPTVATSGQ